MRKTNRQKWDELIPFLEAKETDFLQKHFNGKETPSKIYKAEITSVVELEITEIKLRRPHQLYAGDKPTNKEISFLKSYIERFDVDKKDIIFQTKEVHENYMSSSAESLKTMLENERLSFVKSDVLGIHKELNIKYGKKEGHTACAYCGKQNKNEDSYIATITYRDSERDCFGNYRTCVKKSENKYCNGTCATHDQFAHEG